MSDKNLIRMDRLRKLIEGIPARQYIADEIGCDVSLITKHYNGQRTVTIDYLVKYANYFGVSTDYLLGLADPATRDPKIKAICEYTGLSETAVNTLHERISNIEENNDKTVMEHIENHYIFRFINIFEYKKIVSDFIASSYFEKIIDCFYDEVVTKTNAYNDGARIANGDLSEFIDCSKSDLFHGYVYWKDLVNAFHADNLYKDHRLNLFNVQEYILSYAKSLTDFDNSKSAIHTIENILVDTDLKLGEYFQYMVSSYPDELWKNDDEFINELCNEMKKEINTETERIKKLINAGITEG